MNNISLSGNFKASPIASTMAPNLNASLPMFGGRRKRYRNRKKGGMDPKIQDTPEKDKPSRVTPFLGNPKNLFGNQEIIEEELIEENPVKNNSFLLEVADDKDYDNLENIMDSEKSINEKNENRMGIDEEDVLSKMESGNLDKYKGGSRSRKHRTKFNKTKKFSKKTKKVKRRSSSKKSRKSRRLSRK